jgi:hypothetical protein
MDRKLRDQVWRRAASHCEYCRMPQEFAEPTHEIDHVIAEKHNGPTTLENLALACFHCNNHKGPNIAGVDPVTGEVTRLFHPRQDSWIEHFSWQGATLVGKTPVGRVTVQVLEINIRHRVIHRQALIEEGVFPPKG